MIRRCGNCGAEWQEDGSMDCYSCNSENTYLLPSDIDVVRVYEKQPEDNKYIMSGWNLKNKLKKHNNG